MKILHTVEFYHPSVGGMQEVVRQLSERLVKFGHDVTVATTRFSDRNKRIINGVKIVEFEISGNMVRDMKGEVDLYRNYLLDNDFDIITNFAAQQWATDIMLPLLDRIKAKKIFVPTGFSSLYLAAYKEYFDSMKLWMKKYDMNIFLSKNYRDLTFARDCGVKDIVVIPNGASEKDFLAELNVDIRKKLGIPKKHFLILHVGAHTGVKGHREAIEIFNAIRIKNATFLMVADGLGGCARECRRRQLYLNILPWRWFGGKKLMVLQLSREDTVAAYKEADLFLFPSNIECSPLVLFECMASKTPFLTTDVGNAAEIIESSGVGLLLPTTKNEIGYSYADINESARLLESIYYNIKKREQMKENGFRVWKSRFSWELIARQYEELYFSLVKK